MVDQLLPSTAPAPLPSHGAHNVRGYCTSNLFRSFRYPLYPTKAQEEVLAGWLASCCDLYNGALQERREAWRRDRRRISLYEQQRSLTEIRRDVVGWSDVPTVVARSALRGLDKAMKAFVARCKRGNKPGFPRFRSKRRYDSFRYQGPITILGGRVLLRKAAGSVKFHEYRPLRGKVLDTIIHREAGRWYVIFQCDMGAAPEPIMANQITPVRSVGIDVGLTALATFARVWRRSQ